MEVESLALWSSSDMDGSDVSWSVTGQTAGSSSSSNGSATSDLVSRTAALFPLFKSGRKNKSQKIKSSAKRKMQVVCRENGLDSAEEREEKISRRRRKAMRKKRIYPQTETIYVEDNGLSLATEIMQKSIRNPRYGMQSHVDEYLKSVQKDDQGVISVEEVDVPIADSEIEKAFKSQIYSWGQNHRIPTWAAHQLMKKIGDETERKREYENREISCTNMLRPWRWPKMWYTHFLRYKGDIAFPAYQERMFKNSENPVIIDEREAFLLNDIVSLICQDKVEDSDKIILEGGIQAVSPWDPLPALKLRNKLFGRSQVQENTMRSMALVHPKPGDPQPGSSLLNTDCKFVFFDYLTITTFKRWKKLNHGIDKTYKEKIRIILH